LGHSGAALKLSLDAIQRIFSWSKSAFKDCRPFSGCGFFDSVFLNINSTIHQNFLARLEDFKKFEEKVLSGRKS
jgi:hypothetical protein